MGEFRVSVGHILNSIDGAIGGVGGAGVRSNLIPAQKEERHELIPNLK